MVNFNAKKVLLGLSFVALAASANADWSNVTNKYLKEPAFTPGWCGALTDIANGVGEVYNGSFEIYQIINDAPAGEYTLSATAFFRYGTNEFDMAYQGVEGHDAYLYLGTAKVAVKHLYLGGTVASAPNSTDQASTAFQTDLYLNTVKFNHAGGDLRLGIYTAEDRIEMWTCFDNFKLVGPNGEVAIENGDFSQGFVDKGSKDTENSVNPYGSWDIYNSAADPKTPDFNKGGGVYRKTNASPANIGQQIELPAGKYRWGVQSFYRHGNGNQAGWFVGVKGSWSRIDEKSAYDLHTENAENIEYHPYLYVSTDEYKPLTKEDGQYTIENHGLYKNQPIKCIFDETLDVYPDNEPNHNPIVDGERGWCDSGYECEAARVMINNPKMYRNYVEFELTAPTKVWVGYVKEKNEKGEYAGITSSNYHYWNPFRDFTLEQEVAGTGAVDGIAVDNADVTPEYYNLQGIRVAEPTNGIFIVRKGNKAEKVVF